MHAMSIICDIAWRQKKIPDGWKKAINVSLYKYKGTDECNCYRL